MIGMGTGLVGTYTLEALWGILEGHQVSIILI